MDKNVLSEEMLAILFEKAPDAIYLNDLKGTFMEGNEQAEKITGYPRNDLIGKSFLSLNLLPRKELPMAAANLGKNFLGQATGPDEFTLNRKDGTQIRVEIRTYPVKYKGKTIVMGIARNISKRKQIELELEKTQYGYQKLIEQASDAIIVTSETQILYANNALAQLLGYKKAEDVIGISPDSFYNPDHLEQINEYMTARRRGEYAPPRYQMKINTRNGETIEIEIQVTLIEWQGTIASLGILRDITQQKLFESRRVAVYQLSALLSQATTVEEITEKTLDIISQVMDYEIVTFQTLENEHLLIKGVRGVEKYDKPIPIDDKGLSVKAARLKKTINTPEVRLDSSYIPGSSNNTLSELDVPLISGDVVRGVINVESRKLNAFSREDEIILELLAQHVASALERVQIAMEKESYERELFMGQIRLEQEQELNQLKTRFMSTATHEIRTPLASIQGYTEIIQDELENLSENQRKYFGVILRNVHRLSVLTDDLLNLQRLEEGRLSITIEDVDLNEFQKDVMNEFNPFLNEKNQTIHCNCLDATITMDRLRVMQVIINLLSNASKFSPVGGQITLDAKKIGGNIQFTVSDNGLGVSKEDLPKLFTPFPGIMVEGNVRGTGLGLSISKGIVELHGGEIWAESDGPGKGSTITFTLPFNE